MTIAKITGNGWQYLTRHTARGDAEPSNQDRGNDSRQKDPAAYYTTEGNPPGRWTGRAAHLLGLEGKLVTEEQMRNLFGHGAHPDADQRIAAYLGEHITAAMTERQRKQVRDDAIRHATLGRRFPQYQPLDRFDDRVGRRLKLIEKETGRDPTQAEVRTVKAQEARRQRAAVAGFDLTFSPVKSAALLWSVDDRPHVRDAIKQAHEQAVRQALDLVEDHGARTRTGTGGITQITTKGLVAAAFEHWDSRAGDPDLHTHVAVSSKVQGADGTWRSLDARGLYRMTVAASECYNTAFEAALTQLLGVSFTARPDTASGREPVREITGIPPSVIGFFSRRRAAIETRYTQLLREYRTAHGRDPDADACHKLAQQATLDTRQDKKPPAPLPDKRARWRAELTAQFGPDAIDRLKKAVPGQARDQARHPAPDPSCLAERIIATVAARRSTWTRWNVRAETERVLRSECPSLPLEEHRAFADTVTSLALSPAHCISVEAPALLDEPPGLRREDGESVFTEHAAVRYTSQAILDAEQRLLDAARTPTVNGLAGLSVAGAIDGFEAISGRQLDSGQRNLVTAFAADDRLLLAGIGPAGTGKTTAMRAYAHVLRQAGHRVIPLATSAAAAGILGQELSLPSENLHKFVLEWAAGPFAARLRAGDSVPGNARPFLLRPGDVLLVDEAGMAGTFLLDQLVAVAASRGATVRLLGDDRQLSAVESGGALRLIAAQPGTPELTVLHRFRDAAEADATLRIRAGDAGALDFYQGHGRIRGGSREAMTQAAYDGWKTDMLAGKTTLMAAGDGSDVTALAARARADRVAAGQVEPEGVALRDGTLAGAGDWIVTRHNDRRLSACGGRDWVKNGDAWTVEQRHDDGSLTVKSIAHGGRVTLPAAYVAAHVQLLYATTAHRAQGATVDTAHSLITAGLSREVLYVLASRAREKTTLYVATHDLPFDEDARVYQVRTDPRSYAAREILLNIIATEGAALSATETITTAQDEAGSLATLVPRYLHAAHQHVEGRYRDAAFEVFGADSGRRLADDPAWAAVVRRLYDAEAAGWAPARLLSIAKDMRELDTADSVAEVISWRIDAILADTPEPPRDGQPYESPAAAKARLADVAVAALGPRRGETARSETAWSALIAALRRAEHHGHDAAQLLAEALGSCDLRTARSISEVLAWRISRCLVEASANGSEGGWTGESAPPVRDKDALPWLAAPPAGLAEPGTLPGYIDDAAALISARVTAIADRAVHEHPAWMSMLGQPPADPARHREWRRHVAIIAAYRDQHRVTTDDPRQVLGPYPEPGRAGHAAYWHAASSVLAARRLSGLDQAAHGRRHAAHEMQMAADIYQALPDDERAAIASAVAADAGVLWLGDRNRPDEHAAAQTAYAEHLATVLAARGYTAEHETGLPATAEAPVEAAFARRERTRRRQRGGRPVPPSRSYAADRDIGADRAIGPQATRPRQATGTSPPAPLQGERRH